MKDKYTLLALLASYFIPARFIFAYVYNSSTVVIDEVFHLPIGLKYCLKNYSQWDDKITTLPGLYLFSSLLTAPYEGVCTVYVLRYTVFFTSLINLVLVYYIRKEWHPNESEINHLINVFNIVTTPPILFFSMVYYTDILSMTLVNAMILFGLKGRSFWASLFGFLSLITRQNNAVYILFIAGFRVLQLMCDIITKSESGHPYKWDWRYFKIRLNIFLKSPVRVADFYPVLIEGLSYSVPLISIGFFIYLNHGVVVGDKTAHTTSLHFPQVFYFSLFALFFCWPHTCIHMLPFFKQLLNFPRRNLVVLAIIALIVYFNTIIHPYFLADNRHYSFYVWKYFLGTPLQRFVACPVYLCALYCLWKIGYRAHDPRFVIVYIPMLLIILCTQSLIDVRYFMTPYVILRSYIVPTTRIDLLLELFFQCLISGFTLYTFGTKEIYWKDYEQVQRLIW